MSKFIAINPKESELRIVHNLLLGGVAPRPIALVSSISEEGINNLAPFSFFNAFGANPPCVAFSPSFSGKDGSAKDTLENVKKIPECVIQAVTYDLAEQVNLASTTYPKDIDEFVKSGLTPINSVLVKAKRVKESPFQMECRVEQIIPLGGEKASGNLVLCRVILFHVSEEIYKNGMIDPQLIDLVGRNSANYYTRASGKAIFEIQKPQGIGIGIDQLPEHIKRSNVLTARNLAQLGGMTALPPKESVVDFMHSFKTVNTDYSQDLLQAQDYRRICGVAFSLPVEEKERAMSLLETAAKKALEKQDVPFAMKALLTIPMIQNHE